MTLNELMQKISEILPEAEMGDDLDGQIIIYTNMMIDRDENLISFTEDEDQTVDDDDEEVSDLGSFPKNDAGEPLMSGEAYRYEQYLNAEPDPGDPYDDYFDYDDEEQ